MSRALIAQSTPSADTTAIRAAVDAALEDPAITRLHVEPRDPRSPVAVPRGSVPVFGDVPDRFLSQVIAALMIADRLDVEVAYAAPARTPATRVYRLPVARAAAELAESGTARAVPLVRDDAATVLVGYARHLPWAGETLEGESYVDDHRLFSGEVAGIRIEPTVDAPGVRARVERSGLARLAGSRWATGRAAQTGGANLVVEREGVLADRTVKRSTFYRHHVDLRLVLP